jgi:hypothetical protein
VAGGDAWERVVGEPVHRPAGVTIRAALRAIASNRQARCSSVLASGATSGEPRTCDVQGSVLVVQTGWKSGPKNTSRSDASVAPGETVEGTKAARQRSGLGSFAPRFSDSPPDDKSHHFDDHHRASVRTSPVDPRATRRPVSAARLLGCLAAWLLGCSFGCAESVAKSGAGTPALSGQERTSA